MDDFIIEIIHAPLSGRVDFMMLINPGFPKSHAQNDSKLIQAHWMLAVIIARYSYCHDQ
jgi:hypothetical protein